VETEGESIQIPTYVDVIVSWTWYGELPREDLVADNRTLRIVPVQKINDPAVMVVSIGLNTTGKPVMQSGRVQSGGKLSTITRPTIY
jgi:hypothetical protein